MAGLSEKEALAGLRILVAVAKADGKVTTEERAALESALEAIPGAAVSVSALLEQNANLDELIPQITSIEAREQVYQSAYSLAHADGEASPEEMKIIDRLRTEYRVADEKVAITKRLFQEAKDTVLPSHIQAVADPAKRAKEIREDVYKYSILTGVLGAFPVPGVAIATDLAIVALQVKMTRDIGLYWGHKMDKQAAKSLLGGLGLGTGARIAVSNLAKLVPGWGSAFGAASAFAATWALGKIANRYFENDGKLDMGLLKKEMKAAEKEGKAAFEENKAAIEAKQKEAEGKLAALNADLRAGKLAQDEYEKQVASLS